MKTNNRGIPNGSKPHYICVFFIFMFVDVLHPDESPTVNAEGDKPIDETSRINLTKAEI